MRREYYYERSENIIYRREYKKAVHDFFSWWDWEWFCSLNVPFGSNINRAEKYLRDWCRESSKEDKIQIAYEGALVFYPNHHIHLLMFGKNRFGETLLDRDPQKWEINWSRITKESAKIEIIHDRDGVIDYVSYKNISVDNSELLRPYNKKLLEKKKWVLH